MDKRWTIVVIVLIILAIPLILSLRSKPLDFEHVEDAFKHDGMSVSGVSPVKPPQMNAASQVHMTVNASDVDVFHFDSQEALDKCLKYYAQVAQQEESAPPEPTEPGSTLGPPRTEVATNKMFVLSIRSRNPQVRARVLYLFKAL